MKVAVISLRDFANVGTSISRAVNEYTEHESRCISLLDGGAFSYKRDVVLINIVNGRQILNPSVQAKAKLIIETADILHFKGDDPIKCSWKGFSKLLDLELPKKPTIISVEGSKFRRYMNGKREPFAQAVWPFSDYVSANLRTAMTADLNYKEYNGIYTQQGIDSKQCMREWKPRDIPIICHSPSIRSNKGTETFLKAVSLVQKDIKLELRLIEGVSNDECIRLKKESTLFFDQSVVGFYGIAALEAMKYGIPTMCWIPEQHIKQSNGKLNSDIPIIHNFDPTVEGIADQIRIALTKINLDDLSKRTKTWMDSFHDTSIVGAMWGKIYDIL